MAPRVAALLHRTALLAVGLLCLCGAGGSGDAARIDPQSFLEHVKYLASDDLQGRGNGSQGLEKAAEYIARHFRAAHLEPGGDRAAYFQAFELAASITVAEGNLLTVTSADRTIAGHVGADYYPIALGSGPAGLPERLPMVFAGYGITAPALGYDDYAGIDVGGKAVIIFTHEPQEQDPTSVFDGKTDTIHGMTMQKAMVAREHGARLVLLVEDPDHDEEHAIFERWLKDPQVDEYGIDVARVSRELARQVLPSLDLNGLARAIDSDLKPRSQAIAGASVTYKEHLVKNRRMVRNVIGVLPGSDPTRRSEAIVIGAHYDHLGLGGRSSLVDNPYGMIHNGADDNASGTSALLEIARAAASSRESFPRTIVFVAFAGEEVGLLGSAYYVNHPTVPLDDTTAMINLDMIGRPQGRILLSGLDSAPSLQEDVDAAGKGVPLDIKTFREGANVGSSDDTSFVLRRIPSIGFFSGFHADYHKPSDDWQKIDAPGGAAVASMALALARHIANRSTRPEFAEETPHGHESATASAGTTGGYGPYFGSVPDFGSEQEGVRFADVRAGSPASKAGFRRGDVLVEFDGKKIRTLYDFTFALRQKRPGDKVEVAALRDGQEIRATVELENRR